MLSSPVIMNRSIGEVQFSFMIVHVRLCFIRTDAVTDEGASKSGLQIQILVLCMIFVFRHLGMTTYENTISEGSSSDVSKPMFCK